MVTFIPLVLINQFKFFFNLFFLVIAITQFVPVLRVGFLFTYLAPLCFVLGITMLKEAWDDFQRYRRDKELNQKEYTKVTIDGREEAIESARMKVGDLIKVKQNERIPADLVMLYTSEECGDVFIRTDQLDGETDWKLRRAVQTTQKTFMERQSFEAHELSYLKAEAPSPLIYNFKGKFYQEENQESENDERLTLENTLWSNTVLASKGFIIGIVVYTGDDTRAQMNSKLPGSKFGLLDLEINFLSKVLFVFMMLVALVILVLNGFYANWYIFYFRFVLLLSSIIPISLRVNLDLAKIFYSYCIGSDKAIPDTIPRNSTIPEELGRIQYLLSDKTGTLTKNEMEFKKLAMEYATYSEDMIPDI